MTWTAYFAERGVFVTGQGKNVTTYISMPIA